MDLFTRFLSVADAPVMHKLYCEIANHPGGFARDPEEVTPEYMEKLLESTSSSGLGIGAVDRESQALIGFIIARKPGPKVFNHVLSDLTIGVHPQHQSKGIGRRLFLDFIEHIQSSRPDVLRVELIARESNQRAISFYESIGFRAEGVFEKRILNQNGDFESDIPMGWLKPGL